MPYNGTGTFVRVHRWTEDAANAINITDTRMDAEFDGMATALSTAIAKDGQTTVTANLPMAGFRHTGVGNSSSRTQYAATGQVQDGGYRYVADTGAADAYAITLVPAVTAYAAGQMFWFLAANSNTGASTLAVNALATKAIQKHGAALSAGAIVAGRIVAVVYDGTQFEIVSESSGGWELIASAAASASAAVDFIGLTSAYFAYAVIFNDVRPGTDNTDLHLLTDAANGASFDVGATNYTNLFLEIGAAAAVVGGAATTDHITIATNLGTAADEGCFGIVHVLNPSDAGSQTAIIGTIHGTDATGTRKSHFCSGQRLADHAVNAIRFIQSSGTIASGAFRLYGIRGA